MLVLYQEEGRPVVVSRAVGLLDCLVRSCLDEGALSEAEHVIDQYDKIRVSVDTLEVSLLGCYALSAMLLRLCEHVINKYDRVRVAIHALLVFFPVLLRR